MKSHEIRDSFINYFNTHGHSIVESSRLIPENDPSLLFTNAGMNQFKNVFLGLESPDYTRAASAQKCVRAGGKHNDLENVGHTARHHTFFEMLGNFSFGDYFKKEAIHFAWEFLTKNLGLDKNRLYITVFETDDEAADLWKTQEGIPSDHLYRFGEKDNFWRMGNTGPCGPSSEIFYDFGPDVGGDPKSNVMGGHGDRFVEIWNLVFMQYNEDSSGQKHPLPKPSIDTGAGLERLCTILQGKLNNYDTDVFQEIIQKACLISKKEYIQNPKALSEKALKEVLETRTALRVLADHARSAAFLIADGVLPSNEGRGYVLRRIIRRGIRYGRTLSEESLLPEVVGAVIKKMGPHYPELIDRKSLVLQHTTDEEKRFLKTLDQGTHLLNNEIKLVKSVGGHSLSGESAFKLYDTFGFPMDLTQLMAKEQGLKVNEDEFNTHMKKAKELARASWKSDALGSDQAHLITLSTETLKISGPTEFTGYESLSDLGTIIKLSNGHDSVDSLKPGDTGLALLDKSCFYGESGGQTGDSGSLSCAHGFAEVLACSKINDIHLLHIKVTDGELKNGDCCEQLVLKEKRTSVASNHSATHLLHSALSQVLGDHIQQAGSLVESQRLRFDFTHNAPLSKQQIETIENLVNKQIDNHELVSTTIMTPSEAKNHGATALFGEKYGDRVRVVKMGEFSMELCGGTHVNNTSEIGLFKLVSESGVSSGVRRIEAITGKTAREFVLKNTREALEAQHAIGSIQNWSDYLNSTPSTLSDWIDTQKQKVKTFEKKIQQLKSKGTNIDEFLEAAVSFEKSGIKGQLILADIPLDDRKILSDISDQLKNKAQPAVVIVIGKGPEGGPSPLIVSVSKELTKHINAGQLLKTMATEMGGKGGGRPDFAQGSAPDREKLQAAFEKAKQLVI